MCRTACFGLRDNALTFPPPVTVVCVSLTSPTSTYLVLEWYQRQFADHCRMKIGRGIWKHKRRSRSKALMSLKEKPLINRSSSSWTGHLYFTEKTLFVGNRDWNSRPFTILSWNHVTTKLRSRISLFFIFFFKSNFKINLLLLLVLDYIPCKVL